MFFTKSAFALFYRVLTKRQAVRRLIFIGAVFFWTAVTTLIDCPDVYADLSTSQALDGAMHDYVNSLTQKKHYSFIAAHNTGRKTADKYKCSGSQKHKNARSRVAGYLKRGHELYHQISSGILSGSSSYGQQDYAHDIVALIWVFYEQALQWKQAFHRGTFVFKDPGLRVYSFLRGYVDRFGSPHKRVHGMISFNPFAYPRCSTHFAEVSKKHQQYGIDVRFGARGKLQYILPANKAHLLFGIVDEQKELIFLKPESAGVYWRNGWLGHVGGLLGAVGRHCGMHKVFGKTESIYNRCEHAPKQLIKNYKKLLNGARDWLTLSERNQIYELARTKGIHVMFATCNSWLKQGCGTSDWRELVRAFVDEIKEVHDELDNCSKAIFYRRGREVLIVTSIHSMS
jgi:hypothetical protein